VSDTLGNLDVVVGSTMYTVFINGFDRRNTLEAARRSALSGDSVIADCHQTCPVAPGATVPGVGHLEDVERVCGNEGGEHDTHSRLGLRAGHRHHTAEPSRPVFFELLPLLVGHHPFARLAGLPVRTPPHLSDVAGNRRRLNMQLACDSRPHAATNPVLREEFSDLDAAKVAIELAHRVVLAATACTAMGFGS
jgi:hypothetical protein